MILLIADGLNERPNTNWREFFEELKDDALGRSVAVLATSRPEHWRAYCEQRGMTSFTTLNIAGYADAELDRKSVV